MKRSRAFHMAMLCITVFLAATGVLEAAQYRLGAHYPAGYFCNNGFRRMADKIKEATNGEVDIVLYESGALGSYEQVFQEVMRGTVDMVTNYPTSRFNKKFELVGTPSLANGYDELNKLTQRPSPFHKYLESIYDESGVVFIGSFVDTIGGANVRKGKTIEHPYDTSNKQCQMRVVALTAVRKWWAAMGYQLANVPYAEVFTSMQTGVIDGDSGSGPEGAFLSFGDAMGTFIEYPNYFYLLDFVVSKKAWDSFDDKTKQIIIDAFDAEQEVVFKEAKESYDTYLQKIKDAGKTVLSPTPDDIKVMDETAYEHSWPETAKITGPEVLQAIKEYLGK